MNRLKVCLLLLSCSALSACGELSGVVCTREMRPNLVVEVREAESGSAASVGATGAAHHLLSGVSTELYSAFNDSLRLYGKWDGERAGLYEVVVRKPGFRTDTVQVNVDEDRCHVRTRHVPVTLTREAT